ncbi:TonB-dependent receptor [Caulobacter soli]|uniref:TonB-dependent receptor n=1 Tax=Caulobacter soli TaxID=2708539 RepID=UPI0013EA6A84|nr:TonB-dependent receptor [Caulobacter soli]
MNIASSAFTGKKAGLVLGCSLAALCWAAGAQAQAQAPAAPSAPAQAPKVVDDTSIEEIIVTAQRREERLQDVPIAVAAVTGQQLEKQGILTTNDLGRAVPSATITNFSGYVVPRIRGVGNSVIGPGYEGGVATYIDGVYIASAPASLLALHNIERIEVLKGPQGTLFGRNATGGLIQVVTHTPSADPSGTIEIGAGNYQTATADVYVTGGLGGSVAADFAGHVGGQGKGYGVNRFNGKDVYKANDDIAVRTSLLYTPGDNTAIRLSADYQKNNGSLYTSSQLAPGTGSPLPQGYINSAWDINADLDPYSTYEGGGVSVRIDQTLGFGHLSSITAYRKSDNAVFSDIDSTPTPAVGISTHQYDHQFSQELQLSSGATSPIQWVTGLYYFQSAGRFDPVKAMLFGPFQQPSPLGTIGTSYTYGNQRVDALAGYAQATAAIADQTNLTVGLRYSTERHRLDASQSFDVVGGPSNVPLPAIPNQSKRYSDPTWRISLDHRFSPEAMVYASYNRGFKSGGYNVPSPAAPAFAPETLDAYEVGLKSDLFNRRFRLNAAAFYYDYKNLQVLKADGVVTTVYNGAASTVYGLDLDFEARLSSNFTLSGGATLLHDRFTDFPAAIIANQVPGGVVTTIGSAKGNRLPQTPDFAATVTADYHVPTSFGAVGANVSYSYNDGYYSQPDNILRQPSYNTVAATLRMELPHGIGLRLWGRNLTNAKITQNLSAGTLNSVVTYAAPRTFGLTVSADF